MNIVEPKCINTAGKSQLCFRLVKPTPKQYTRIQYKDTKSQAEFICKENSAKLPDSSLFLNGFFILLVQWNFKPLKVDNSLKLAKATHIKDGVLCQELSSAGNNFGSLFIFGIILASKPTTKKTTKRTTTTSTTTSTISTTKIQVPCMTVNNKQVCFAVVKSKSSNNIKHEIEKVRSICIANGGVLPSNSLYTGPLSFDFELLVKKNFPTLKRTVAMDMYSGKSGDFVYVFQASHLENGLLCRVKASKVSTLQSKVITTPSTTTTTTTTTTTITSTTTTTTATSSTTTTTTTMITTTTNSTTSTMSEKYFQTQVYIQSVERRLKNFERLLNLKVANFNKLLPSVDAKPRLVWLMVTEDLVRKYVERHEKREKVNNIESIFKLIATVFLLGFFLSLLYIFYQMYRSLKRKYEKKKAAKEKRKKRLKKKRKRTLSKL